MYLPDQAQVSHLPNNPQQLQRQCQYQQRVLFKAPRRNPHHRHLSSPVSNPKLPDNRISDPTHSSRRPQRTYLRSGRFRTVQDANPHGENHKNRKSQAQDGEHRQEVSPHVFDHQRCMAQLQTKKSRRRSRNGNAVNVRTFVGGRTPLLHRLQVFRLIRPCHG